MRVTPLDIKKQEFKKVMRGLDADEVHAFLNTVAEEYEAVLSDNKNLREKLVALEERLNEFKSIETNLRNTLLTAEKLTQEAKENARREASLIVRQAEMEAEKAAEAIRANTTQLRREILELKKNKDNYIARLKTLIDSHARMLDGFAEDFAGVDQAIEKIGKKVEEDASRPAAPPRMSRDKITQDFGHEAKDKVTWGEEPRREEEQRPQVPRPGTDRGEPQAMRPKAPEDGNIFAVPRAAAPEYAAGEPPQAPRQPQRGGDQPRYDEPQPPRPAEQLQMEPLAGSARVVTAEPPRQAPPAGTEQAQAPAAPDSWRGYEVRKEAVDWKKYVIDGEGPRPAPREAAQRQAPPADAELDDALSSLSEAAGAVEGAGRQDREAPQNAQPPAPQARAPRPEPVNAEGRPEQGWSMDELRRNLSNLSKDEGHKG